MEVAVPRGGSQAQHQRPPRPPCASGLGVRGCSQAPSRPLGEKPPSLTRSVSACHGPPGATAAATRVLLGGAGEGHGREDPGAGRLLLSPSRGTPSPLPGLKERLLLNRCPAPSVFWAALESGPDETSHSGSVVLHPLACPGCTCYPVSFRCSGTRSARLCGVYWGLEPAYPKHPQMLTSDILRFITCLWRPRPLNQASVSPCRGVLVFLQTLAVQAPWV